MRRVLIVTGSYAPTIIADMHRARQLAWQLPEFGWEVEIFCPDVAYQPPSCNDADGAEFFAPAIPVHAVPPQLPGLFRALGIGGIGLRALAPMLREGRNLLAARRFDLVYFSTAQWPLFLLGPAWRKRLGTPYVLDLHDPVAPRLSTALSGLKHRLGGRLSGYIEARAAAGASGLIAVSPQYLDLLRVRYAKVRPAWLAPGRQAVIPFGVRPRDLEEASRSIPGHGKAVPGPKRIVYVGTGGPIMARSFALLCRALARLRTDRPGLLAGVRIELHGTASALADRAAADLAGIAGKSGAADLVVEHPARVTYRRSLELLLESAGALVLGVDDPGYMPSKLFTYAYSGKPLLACVRRDGPALAAFRAQPGLGHALWFAEHDEMPLVDAAAVVADFLAEVAAGRTFSRRADLAPHTSAAMARRHAELFDACLP